MTPTPQINLLVIGQSPRADLEREFRRVITTACEIRTIGALDGVSDEQMLANGPQSNSDTLFSILPDGRTVLLSKKFVTERLQEQVRGLRAAADCIHVMCCTGHFPELTGQPIITASRVLQQFVLAAASAGTKLGVFIPKPQQVDHATARWSQNGFEAIVVPLAPDASGSDVDIAAKAMGEHAPDLLVYDCISYRHSTRQQANAMIDAPAIVASSATAHLVAELIGTRSNISLG